MSVITVCIPTLGERADELRECLNSIKIGRRQPRDVVVCADRSNEQIRSICEEFSAVHLEGKDRGLAAARNQMIDAAEGSFALMLDDDALLTADFILEAEEAIQRGDPMQVISGCYEDSEQGYVGALRSTYLGFFAPATPETVTAFNICATLLPRSAFAHIQFDERLRYGYEELDIAMQLRTAGYQIVFTPSLVIIHNPPPRSSAEEAKRVRLVRKGRFLVQLKARRSRSTPLGAVAAAAWLGVASVHEMLATIKRRGSLRAAWEDIRWAVVSLRATA